MAKILIVDDDPDIVDAVRLVMEREHHIVHSAGNRMAGMESLKQVQPDLLILDVMMEQPDDGIAMARELRTIGFRKPIVMLTSLGRVTGLDYGDDEEMVPVDAFFEKPVSARALVQKVTELLARKEVSPC